MLHVEVGQQAVAEGDVLEERGVGVGALRRARGERDGDGVAQARARHVAAQAHEPRQLLLRHVGALRDHGVQVEGEHLDVLAAKHLVKGQFTQINSDLISCQRPF